MDVCSPRKCRVEEKHLMPHHISRHPFLLFLSTTIPEFQPLSGSVGFIYSFHYPFLMAVEPRTTQCADTNNISCPFVLRSTDLLSLCPYP